MLKTISHTDINTITQDAREAAYTAAALFGSQHRFKEGDDYGDDNFFGCVTGKKITQGFFNHNLDFVLLSKMVIGARLHNQCTLRQVGPLSIPRLMMQSFVGGKAWVVGDVQVSVKKFMEPVSAFLAKYENQVEVFAGVYQNKYTYTNVFGVVILLKGAEGKDRLTWEITIDDADLDNAFSIGSLFK